MDKEEVMVLYGNGFKDLIPDVGIMAGPTRSFAHDRHSSPSIKNLTLLPKIFGTKNRKYQETESISDVIDDKDVNSSRGSTQKLYHFLTN